MKEREQALDMTPSFVGCVNADERSRIKREGKEKKAATVHLNKNRALFSISPSEVLSSPSSPHAMMTLLFVFPFVEDPIHFVCVVTSSRT